MDLRIFDCIAWFSLFARAFGFARSVLVDLTGGSDCLDTSRNDKIPLTITNRSTRRIAFLASGTSRRPYVLHPYAFAIDIAEPKSVDKLGVLVEHYVSAEE